MKRRRTLLVALVALLSLLAAACGDDKESTSTSSGTTAAGGATASGAPGTGGSAIGFIFVGPRDDFGYNQAAYQGSEEVKKAFPNLKVLQAENVPETAEAERVVEDMIKKGAKIIFTTSYGHRDYGLNIAKKHPDVVVLQQGNFLKDPQANMNTYFGNVYETVYLAGIAAGKATKTGKLGFVAAFPIPQTLLNVNAFELGAKSVRPDATTTVVFTSNWCDTQKQADAANSLLSANVDVITQHQDCTGTIVKAVEAKGAFSVGYHADASSLAPKGWLTGSEWNWGPLYVDMVKEILAGKFVGGKYAGNYRIGFEPSNPLSPLTQSKFGPSVSDDTKKAIDDAKKKLSSGGGSVFAGPVVAQDGSTKIASGVIPKYADLENMDYLVQGVTGQIPK